MKAGWQSRGQGMLGRRFTTALPMPGGSSPSSASMTVRGAFPSRSSSSSWWRRSYALTSDGRFIKSNVGGGSFSRTSRVTTYLRPEDAKELEDRFLKVITPQGKDPWTYNRHLLPRFAGMKGDANVPFAEIRTPEKLVEYFLEHMTYPNELGHSVKVNSVVHPNRALHHWADERVFGMPPIAVVRLQYVDTPEEEVLTYAEIHWWRRVLRVYEIRSDIVRDEDGNIDDDDDEADTLYKRQAAEYPIPPRWLLEMKRKKWPAPPSEAELDLSSVEEPEPVQARSPLTTEPFPHRQATMLGRSFTAVEEGEVDDVEKDDPTDETIEDLAVGNVFVPKGTTAEDLK